MSQPPTKYVKAPIQFEIASLRMKQELSQILTETSTIINKDYNSNSNDSYNVLHEIISRQTGKYFPKKFVKFKRYKHKKIWVEDKWNLKVDLFS